MVACKRCGKELVGSEKKICKSCKDKGLDTLKKVGKGAAAVVTLVASAFVPSIVKSAKKQARAQAAQAPAVLGRSLCITLLFRVGADLVVVAVPALVVVEGELADFVVAAAVPAEYVGLYLS